MRPFQRGIQVNRCTYQPKEAPRGGPLLHTACSAIPRANERSYSFWVHRARWQASASHRVYPSESRPGVSPPERPRPWVEVFAHFPRAAVFSTAAYSKATHACHPASSLNVRAPRYSGDNPPHRVGAWAAYPTGRSGDRGHAPSVAPGHGANAWSASGGSVGSVVTELDRCGGASGVPRRPWPACFRCGVRRSAPSAWRSGPDSGWCGGSSSRASRCRSSAAQGFGRRCTRAARSKCRSSCRSSAHVPRNRRRG